jgi:hypothetical protein
VERKQGRISADDRLAPEPVEQMRAPLAEVHDPRRHALRVEAQAQDVDRLLEQVPGDAGREQRDRRVACDEAPVTVDHDGRERLVRTQEALERLAHRAHLRLVEVALAVGRRVAGREQQRVALAQRNLERGRELDDHLGARTRAAGLDEAQVARRDARLEAEVELAEPAPLAPFAQQRADGGALCDVHHGADASRAWASGPLPAR